MAVRVFYYAWKSGATASGRIGIARVHAQDRAAARRAAEFVAGLLATIFGDARRRQAEIKVDDKGEPTGETELVHTGKEGGWLPHMAGKNNPSFAAVVGWVMPLDDSVAQRQGKPSLPLAYGLRLISHN